MVSGHIHVDGEEEVPLRSQSRDATLDARPFTHDWRRAGVSSAFPYATPR